MIYANVDEQGQTELRKAMQETKDKKWYCRLRIISLSGQGHPAPILADLFDMSRHTIRDYIHRYNENGLPGHLRPAGRLPGQVC